jgi:hypothetical protein
MRMVQEFSLDRIERQAGAAAAEPRARLRRGGNDTGTVLPGAVLEAQLAADAGWLLFTTHDTPFEEQLDIILIDRSYRIVDVASLYGPYTTGTFRNLAIESGESVLFDFFGDHVWRVTLLDRPRFRLPLARLGEPAGVHRRFGFTRNFAVTAVERGA